jgi:hypothetical protein
LTRRLDIADHPLAFEHLGVYRILLDGDPARSDLRLTVELALKLAPNPAVSDLCHRLTYQLSARAMIRAFGCCTNLTPILRR